MDRDPTARKDIENLRLCVQDAKLRLDFAVNYLKEVEEDGRSQLMPASESDLALQLAIKAEREARVVYLKTLKVYEDLLIGGKLPNEKEQAKSG